MTEANNNISDDERIRVYHRHFNEVTNNGSVLRRDLSSCQKCKETPLTQNEIADRQEWSTMRNALADFYGSRELIIENCKFVDNTDRLLKQQVPPPCLEDRFVSPSHASDSRTIRLPSQIYPWDDFDAEVEAFRPENRDIEPRTFTPLFDGLQGPSQDAVGRLDMTLCTNTSERKMLMPVEFKSTHNLLLPLNMDLLVEKYNRAYTSTNQSATEWVNVCNPVAQIVAYMIENRRRYGVLSSGTRTYFLYSDGTGLAQKLRISQGWEVGNCNYLRAWAYIYNCGNLAQGDSVGIPGWTAPSPQNYPNTHLIDQREPNAKNGKPPAEPNDRSNNKSDYEQNSKIEGLPSYILSLFGDELPVVPYSTIDILHPIGHGRNGCAFAARWKGQNVALKQFDVLKGGYGSYIKELEAYKHLRRSWGDLVVKPLFVSESWTGIVMFLGLQRGRSSSQNDVSFESERKEVLDRLFDEHGFVHADVDDGHFVYIPGSSGGAKEKLVMIDLEDYDIYSDDES